MSKNIIHRVLFIQGIVNRFFTYFAIVLKLSKHINIFGRTSVPEYLRMSLINFYICILGNWLLRIVKTNLMHNSLTETIVSEPGSSNYTGIKFEVSTFLHVLHTICAF